MASKSKKNSEPTGVGEEIRSTQALDKESGLGPAIRVGGGFNQCAPPGGISGPQWMILMALADLDKGDGVPVKVVSKMLHVDSSFVTTQSKLLEKKGFMRRKTSENDARVVQMSLTDKSYKHIANLAAEQDALHEFIFAEFSDRELTELTGKLASLKNQFEKACLKVAMDI
jgi:DNA-binding MarR family transcriptional regulator